MESDNFADAPFDNMYTWRSGFDVIAWIEEGDSISDLIEEALPDFQVDRRYRTYSLNRSTARPPQ